MTDSLFSDADVIHRYTRAQAIADGVLVDLSAACPDVCRQHYPVPVACTASVWALIDKAVKNPRWSNDLNGVVHDLLWMSKACRQPVDVSTILFQVIIKGAGRKSNYTFKAVVSGGDVGEPVLTIMLPEED